MTLPEFLLARIAEDEATARALVEAMKVDEAWNLAGAIEDVTDEEDAYGERFTPARVLARCAADRRIVEALADDTNTPSPDFDGGYDYGLELAARALATVYADHEDYRDEWKP